MQVPSIHTRPIFLLHRTQGELLEVASTDIAIPLQVTFGPGALIVAVVDASRFLLFVELVAVVVAWG